MKRLILTAVILVVAGCSSGATPAPQQQGTTPASDQPVKVYRDIANHATCWYITNGNGNAISCVADSVLHP